MIKDSHEIEEAEFTEYSEKFWGKEKPMVKIMNKTQVKGMIDKASDLDYIQFTFTDEKNNVFVDDVVSKHTFQTKCSCLSAITFMALVEDTLFDNVEISKGIKYFPKTTPQGTYEGDYYVALFKVHYTDSNVQYLDIVDDPTRG